MRATDKTPQQTEAKKSDVKKWKQIKYNYKKTIYNLNDLHQLFDFYSTL